MISLYVLCGIPGSGKTTLAHKIAGQHNAKIHTYDDIYNEQIMYEKSWKIERQWIDAINADLLAGYSVVCDGLNLTALTRKWILREVTVPCEKVLIVKAVPLEVCLQRNNGREYEAPEHQIKMAVQAMEAPTKDEGWDAIYLSRE